MTNELRMERCNFFATALYDSVEKCWKAWAISCTCISCFIQQELSNFFFIFTILGEEILVRVQSWTTSASTEHLPKQSSVDSQLQHTLPWLHLPKHGWYWNMFSLPIPSHYFIYDSVYTTVMSLSKTATIVWLFVLPWILCCKPWRLMPHHQLALLLGAVWG